MTTKVLVTGATGLVGREVITRLIGAGVAVRALTRDPAKAEFPAGVEVYQGDLTDPETVAPALEGVERLYLFPVPETATEVVALAKTAGVRRIVVLSAAAVTVGLDTYHHPRVEQAVEASGLEWTHVRPGEFMTNMQPVWAPSIRAERVVRHPFATQIGVPVHEADVAEVAVAALLEDGHAGRAYTLSGPAQITYREQVEAIGAALGEEVRYEEVSREEARELLKEQGGFAAANADFLLGFVDYGGSSASGSGEEPDYSALLKPWPGVRDATGKPGRTFAEWARDHVEDFR
ncbi:NAD(P)H-binding protein [Kribbella sp. NBC_01245]|uniref:SDR family oxidoreductase n=1 Tax=Kribbella sp. NBC_01245 TaxID=2903578 RepID=UPI002E296494|nr:NAD(P)H-binding protein [Kribbella sp. NBC_01245]